jgi:hypothetical protein
VTSGRAAAAASSKPLQEVSAAPTVVTTPAEESTGAFASQVASAARWLAATPCPEPRSEWWFVGVGGSGQHSSTLLLSNPRAGDAVVDVEVRGPKGVVQSPGLRGLFVPSGRTKALDLSRLAPATGDLAVHVSTSRGLVAAAATDSLSPVVTDKPLREWVAPQPAAARELTLTGLPPKVSSATLLVTNPADVEALVEIRGIGAEATFAPKDGATLRVPPGGVGQVPVTALFDGKPLAVSVKADRPVAATVRAYADGDEAYAGAAGAPADGATLAVPEGTTGQVRVSSTGPKGAITVTAYDVKGRSLARKRLAVAAGTSAGVDLPQGTRSVQVRDASVGLVAGLALTGPGGIASAVFETPVQAARTPEVRPAG